MPKQNSSAKSSQKLSAPISTSKPDYQALTPGKKDSKFYEYVKKQDILFVDDQSGLSSVEDIPKKRQIHGDEKEKIEILASASDSILFKASTVFPFTFFTDTIIIDKTKVTIIERIFFFSQQIRSYAIEDILNVEVGFSLLFSTLKCLTRYGNKEVFVLNFLRKNDASFAKKLIQGLIIAKREGVRIEELTEKEIVDFGETIGKGDWEE